MIARVTGLMVALMVSMLVLAGCATESEMNKTLDQKLALSNWFILLIHKFKIVLKRVRLADQTGCADP